MEQFDVEESFTKVDKKEKKSQKKISVFLIFAAFAFVFCCGFALCSYLDLFQINSLSAQNNEKKYAVMVGDIGGTNIRLSILRMSKNTNVKPEVVDRSNFQVINYNSIDDAFISYLSKYKETQNYPIYAVIGIPGPIKNNEILKYANIPNWPKSNGDEIAKKLGIKKLLFLNDFTCNSFGVQTDLKLGEDYIIINNVEPQKGGAKTVIGPGTGLGMGFMVKDENNPFYTIGSSEGGHTDFTAKDDFVFGLRKYIKDTFKYEDVGIERILSGQGLIPMYKYLLSLNGNEEREPDLAKIIDSYNDFSDKKKHNEINIELVKKGLNGQCKLSKKVLELFVAVFGEVAGDISLITLPTNGLYLVGGMSLALEPLIANSNIFMDHFIRKDSYAYLLKTFPIYLVKNGELGMIGATECARRLLLAEE